MSVVADILVAIVAAIHVYILVLEMFLWQRPRTRAAFGTTEAFASSTRVMAANQGLYNGFLAAGLIFGVLGVDPVGTAVTVFFLVCVAVAGVFGAVTVNRRILIIQTVPAALALVAVALS